jgi:hypothetical protein
VATKFTLKRLSAERSEPSTQPPSVPPESNSCTSICVDPVFNGAGRKVKSPCGEIRGWICKEKSELHNILFSRSRERATHQMQGKHKLFMFVPQRNSAREHARQTLSIVSARQTHPSHCPTDPSKSCGSNSRILLAHSGKNLGKQCRGCFPRNLVPC